MVRFIYNLLFPFGLIFFLPGFLVKMIRRGNYRRKFGQRLGIYDGALKQKLACESRAWIHAVSVGEVAIALKLAAKLRERDSNFSCALTTTTTTGSALAEKSAPAWIEVMYHPLDFWPIVRHAFAAIRPSRIILIEAEIWPNLVARARAQGVPVALVNARLSPTSEGRFRKFRFAIAPTFRCLDLVCVQDSHDVEKWTALGIPRDRIELVGSIKFDPENVDSDATIPREILRTLGIDFSRPILLGGSTHASEEKILAEIFLRLRAEFPSLFLIVAPRHAERAAEVASELERLSLRVAMRSAGEISDADCLLLDTTGELRNWYSVATLVFIGKSLTARGGQNPAEPIVAGKAVLFGPHMENFFALAQALVRQNGAIQVQDASALETAIAELLRSPGRRSDLVANGQSVLATHQGATTRTAELVLKLRSKSQPVPSAISAGRK